MHRKAEEEADSSAIGEDDNAARRRLGAGDGDKNFRHGTLVPAVIESQRRVSSRSDAARIEECRVLPAVPYRQGVEEAMRLLSGRWVAAVLAALAEGPLHYTDLLSAINSAARQAGLVSRQRPLTEKVLTETLRRMERDGLLIRHREPTPLPSVWYELTPMARSLLRSLRPLAEWAQVHRKELAAVHERRDEESRSTDN